MNWTHCSTVFFRDGDCQSRAFDPESDSEAGKCLIARRTGHSASRRLEIMKLKLGFLLITSLAIVTAIATVHGQRARSRDRGARRDKEREEREEQTASRAGNTERRFDDPADEESLNRELWEFARHTPYDQILPYLAAEQRKSRASQSAEVELPTGWRIAPAGKQVEVGRLPYEAVPFAGRLVVLNTGYYYKESQEVSVLDAQSARVEKTLKINSLFPSAAVGADGDLYVSGGFDQKVLRIDHQFNVVRDYPVRGFAGGLAAIDSAHIAVGYMAVKNANGVYLNGRLAILNTTSGKIEKEVELGYFPYAVRHVAGKLLVTLLGENKLLIYSRRLVLIKTITVGRTPQEMCTDGQQLYVVNTGSDSLSVIDMRTNRLVSTISVAENGSKFGARPSSCAADSNRLYVTLAGANSVSVIDRRTRTQSALIPTGWYPTRVLVDKDQLLVVSAKGIRARRPNPDGPRGASGSDNAEYVLNLLRGSVSIIPKSDLDQNSESWTEQVSEAAPIFDSRRGLKLPIKHVFYIVKENRTYDQVLGDLSKGNGDPNLTMFGESVTPVEHQLAREFVTLDNFFVDGEISVLGHAFTTSGYASPFIEWFGNASYSERWKGSPFGSVPATMSPVYVWDLLDEKKVDYRIYGETYFLFTRAYRIIVEKYGPESALAHKFYDRTMVAAAGDERGTEFNDLTRAYYGQANTRGDAYKLLGNPDFLKALSGFLTGDQSFAQAVVRDDALRRLFADYLYHYPFSFRSWDLKYSDLDRVREWKKDFAAQIRLGAVAPLHYIWLPNDHTDGAESKILNAFQFVAQNDAALGRIVETISNSPVWKDSLILVVEDDSQNGPDHVDATRTIAFAAGPYVKRGALVGDRYDQLSMLRTVEVVLGLKSLNSAEQLAAPMYGIFTGTPDFRPFIPTDPSRHLADADRERYRELKP
jgi:YVTN family beta-propeller protein